MNKTNKRSNKPGKHDIFVVKGDQVNATAGLDLASSTTALNVADGQVAVLSWDMGSTGTTFGKIMSSSDDSNKVQALRVVVGTPASAMTQNADVWEVNDKAYQSSDTIHKSRIQAITCQKARMPEYGLVGLSGFADPISKQEYRAYLRLLSTRNDQFYGDNDEVIHSSIPATDFGATGLNLTTQATRTDYLLQKLATNFNTMSRLLGSSAGVKKGNRNFVVLGVKASPTQTAATLTATGTGAITGFSAVASAGGGYPASTTTTAYVTNGTTLNITTNSSGVVTGVTIATAGSGYTNSAAVVFTILGGTTNATVSITTNGSGVPTTVGAITGGTGYIPSSTYVAQATAGAIATIVTNATGGVSSATVTAGGLNYVAGTVTLATGTFGGFAATIGAIKPGSVLNFMTYNGVTSSLTVDYGLAISLARLLNTQTTIAAGSTIEVINPTLAGTATGTGIDSLIVVGLPAIAAKVYDDVTQLQTRPEVNLALGFTLQTAVTKTAITPFEGYGLGRDWFIQWRHRAGLQVHNQQIQPHGDWFALGKSYIVEANLYGSEIIDYFDFEDTLTTGETNPKKLVLLIRNEIAAPNANPNVSTIVTNIGTSSIKPINIITSSDAGTGTAAINTVTTLNSVLNAWFNHAQINGNPFQLQRDLASSTTSTYISA